MAENILRKHVERLVGKLTRSGVDTVSLRQKSLAEQLEVLDQISESRTLSLDYNQVLDLRDVFFEEYVDYKNLQRQLMVEEYLEIKSDENPFLKDVVESDPTSFPWNQGAVGVFYNENVGSTEDDLRESEDEESVWDIPEEPDDFLGPDDYEENDNVVEEDEDVWGQTEDSGEDVWALLGEDDYEENDNVDYENEESETEVDIWSVLGDDDYVENDNVDFEDEDPEAEDPEETEEDIWEVLGDDDYVENDNVDYEDEDEDLEEESDGGIKALLGDDDYEENDNVDYEDDDDDLEEESDDGIWGILGDDDYVENDNVDYEDDDFEEELSEEDKLWASLGDDDYVENDNVYDEDEDEDLDVDEGDIWERMSRTDEEEESDVFPSQESTKTSQKTKIKSKPKDGSLSAREKALIREMDRKTGGRSYDRLLGWTSSVRNRARKNL